MRFPELPGAPVEAIENIWGRFGGAGYWTNGLVNNIEHYSRAGQYQVSDLTALKTAMTIAADGGFTYKLSGLLNNRQTTPGLLRNDYLP